MSAQTISPLEYESEVDRRLKYIVAYLRDVEAGEPSSTVLAMWNVRVLMDESRRAGQRDLSGLLGWLERGLMSMAEEATCSMLETSEVETSEGLKGRIANLGEFILGRVHSAADE